MPRDGRNLLKSIPVATAPAIRLGNRPAGEGRRWQGLSKLLSYWSRNQLAGFLGERRQVSQGGGDLVDAAAMQQSQGGVAEAGQELWPAVGSHPAGVLAEDQRP